jgi:TPP-dependent pyruvate/acetoin dehydrogenase alpha subunit
MALDPEDYVAGTYRGHGHALAKGTDPDALIAEMLGRTTGVCAGRSGSMNVIDLEHGLVGCYGIVGGSIAAATGAALAAKRQGRVAVAFFGDGAANQGYFHECLNFCAVGALPAVFVCENNLYGEFTPMAAVTAGVDIAGRAAAYGMPAAVVDGNDLWAVREAAVEAGRERLRPILMTSFAFILGVFPLVVASGAGAVSRHSIGTGVFAGMLFATTVGIFFIPLFFVTIRQFAERMQRHRPQEAVAPAPQPAGDD